MWFTWIGWEMFNMGCMLTYRVFYFADIVQNFLQDMSKYFWREIIFRNIRCCFSIQASLGFQPRSAADSARGARTTQIACLGHSYSVGAVGWTIGMLDMGCMLTYRVFILQTCLKLFPDMSQIIFWREIIFRNMGCCFFYRMFPPPADQLPPPNFSSTRP